MVRSMWMVLILWVGAGAATAAPANDRRTCVTTGDAAIAACSRLIASGREPTRGLVTAHVSRGRLLAAKGDYERAFSDFERAIRLDPRSAAAFYNRAVAFGSKGDYDRAVSDYGEAIRLNPRDAFAFNGRGNAYRGKGDYDRAIADYAEAIRLDPRAAVPRNNRGLAFAGKRDYARAIADYSELIRLNPRDPFAFNSRGNAYKSSGDDERAIADYGEALRLDPKAIIPRNNRGLAWTDRRDYDRAIADFGEVIRLDPTFAAALTNRGLAYERKGEKERARADFQAAIALPQGSGSGKWAADTARERLAAPTIAAPVAARPAEPAPAAATPSATPTPEAASTSAASQPSHRVALLVGNGRYPESEPLLNDPARSAQVLAAELRAGGFEVELGENLTRQGLQRILDAFRKKIRPGTVALLFYGGYAIQAGREAYMIPVDAQVWAEPDVRRDGTSLESVLTDLHAQGADVKLVIVDASLRNPFERRFRSVSAGLGPLTTPKGSLVIYAAGLGQVVNDTAHEQGLFMAELLKEMRAPGATAEEAFARTRIGVSRASDATQVPWVSSSMVDSFSFASSEPRGAR